MSRQGRPTPVRARRVALIAGAACIPLLALGVPGLDRGESPSSAVRSSRTVPAQLDNASALDALWGAFDASQGVESAGLADFDQWIERRRKRGSSVSRAWGDGWSLESSGDERVVIAPGRGGGADLRLVIRERSWPAAEYALAVSDLSCVLCHGEVSGGHGHGNVFSLEAHEPRSSQDVLIEGQTDHGPGAVFLGSPELELGDLAEDDGWIEAARGWTARDGAPAFQAEHLAPLRIEGAVLGPLVLLGTPESPVRFEGASRVDGDVLLCGPIAGDGTLVVSGNLLSPDGFQVDDRNAGLPLIVVHGSFLAGDVLRPRQGMSLPVTGDNQGSFGFLSEVLARFNARDERSFVLLDGQTPVLLPEGPATGDWFDPRLEVAALKGEPVGPAAGLDGEPWLSLDVLRAGLGGEPLARRGAALRVDGTFVIEGAFVAVATGLALGDGDEPAAPGKVLMNGSLAARHAAVHAPGGFELRDDEAGRARLGRLHRQGLAARIVDVHGAPENLPGPGADGQSADRLPPSRARLRHSRPR